MVKVMNDRQLIPDRASKKAKWKKEVLADAPAIQAYINNLEEVAEPGAMKTEETKELLTFLTDTMLEANLRLEALVAMGESDE